MPPSDLWTESQELVESIRQDIYQLRQNSHIVDILNIHEYISPYSENVLDDCPDDLIDDIVAQYTQKDQEEEEEEAIVLQELIKDKDALYALHTLRQYKEQNKHANIKLLRLLRSHEREISARVFQSRQQVTLDEWFLGEKGGVQEVLIKQNV